MLGSSFFVLLSLIVLVEAQVSGVDSSTLVSSSTWTTALNEGFSHAVIRVYQEACGSTGGQVDPNFSGSFNNALSAGYSNIDAYWFPCSGANNPCKSYDQQVSELASEINGLVIRTVFLDIEVDPNCDNWNYGAAGNLQEAQSMVAALQNAGINYGVYSSPGNWGTIFGSANVELDPSAPLWFATFDNNPSLTLKSPFGGWTSAYGKQYSDKSASGKFDLNVFVD